MNGRSFADFYSSQSVEKPSTTMTWDTTNQMKQKNLKLKKDIFYSIDHFLPNFS
jgi:hypothetical protein